MSYSSTDPNQSFNADGALAIGNVGGVIIMGRNGLITQQNALGNIDGDVIFGDTTGPNAVNPSGTPNGIRLPSQNNFGRGRRRR
jgi:hypothetical protein